MGALLGGLAVLSFAGLVARLVGPQWAPAGALVLGIATTFIALGVGTNLMVGVSLQFPYGSDHPNTGWVRSTPSPFRFVERNYNVAVDQHTTSTPNQVATHPTTGQPYIIEQVSTVGAPSATPDGTSANPFSSIAAAQAAGGDIILNYEQVVAKPAGQPEAQTFRLKLRQAW